MDVIIDSLRESVEALDKLPKQYKSPKTTKLRRLTVELIDEMEKDQPDTNAIEGLTEQINELNK